MEKIGFIGLGAMGNPMAANLANNGYEVSVFDVNKEAMKSLKDVNPSIILCESVAQLAKEQDVIFTSLPNGSIVEAIMLGNDGVLESCKMGAVVVDLSSVAPETSRKMYKEAKAHGVSYLDIPVSGGVAGAKAGSLTMMAGGDEETFNHILPVLETIGKNIYYIGESGSGDAMKLVNNMMLGCNAAALAEALTLGDRLGLSLSTMKKIIDISSGRSYVSDAKLEKFIMQNQYDGGFAIALQHKDIGLALEAAKSVKTPLMMAGMAEQIYELAISKGFERKDISALTKMWMENE